MTADGLAGRLDDRGELAGPILSTGQGGQRTTDLNTPLVRDSSDFIVAPPEQADDPLLPPGLDSHRYRCCGNGVVASVAEWIGRALIRTLPDSPP